MRVRRWIVVCCVALFAAACAPSPGFQPPTISGDAVVGGELTASRGEWLFDPTSYVFSWNSCAAEAPSDCRDVGENSDRYSPVQDDLGRLIRISVRAENAAGSSTQSAAPVGPVREPDDTTTSSTTTSSTSTTTTSTSTTTTTTVTPVLPVVTGIDPAEGSMAGGETVTIAGTGFTGATEVSFGGIPATSFTLDGDTSITTVTPPSGEGPVDVVVTTPAGSSTVVEGSRFTFTAPATEECDINWTGAAGDNSWHTSANWDLNRLPTIEDDTCINGPAPSPQPVLIASPAQSARLTSGPSPK